MKPTIAVVGIGIMGNGIATNFLKNGYQVIVWNRNKDKVKELVKKGAKLVNSPKEAAEKADIVFEVTANDESARLVWLGKDGILEGATPKSILITNATLSIPLVEELSKQCALRKLTFFDMPMTGSRAGAETGTLTLFVGGDAKKLKTIEKDLSAISEKVIYFGKAGAGMRYKLLLNTLQAIHVVGLGEMLRIATEIGLDIKKVGDALSERPGGITTKLAWSNYQKQPDEVNFSVEWITKDLSYAKKMIKNLDTPLLNDVLEIYQNAVRKIGKKDWTEVNKLK